MRCNRINTYIDSGCLSDCLSPLPSYHRPKKSLSQLQVPPPTPTLAHSLTNMTPMVKYNLIQGILLPAMTFSTGISPYHLWILAGIINVFRFLMVQNWGKYSCTKQCSAAACLFNIMNYIFIQLHCYPLLIQIH